MVRSVDLHIDINITHAMFYIYLHDSNKEHTFSLHHKKSAFIAYNDISYFHSDPLWKQKTIDALSFISNIYFRTLVLNLVFSRKKWKITIPIISEIYYFCLVNNIDNKLVCLQNNMIPNSLYYISEDQGEYIKNVYKLICSNNFIIDISNIIFMYFININDLSDKSTLILDNIQRRRYINNIL